MLSKYFLRKINTEEFGNYIASLMLRLKDKKVLMYGDGEGSRFLNNKYNFFENCRRY